MRVHTPGKAVGVLSLRTSTVLAALCAVETSPSRHPSSVPRGRVPACPGAGNSLS